MRNVENYDLGYQHGRLKKKKRIWDFMLGGGVEFLIMTTESGEFCDMQLSVKLRHLKQVFHFFFLATDHMRIQPT